MRLTDYLDKGASLGPSSPCLTMGDRTLTYADVQDLSRRVAAGLARSGIGAGDKVAVLSGNDPAAFSCVFGISRAGAVWCPINPRNEAAENRDLLDLFDCRCLIFQKAFAPLVDRIRQQLPLLTTLVCLDGDEEYAHPFDDWLGTERLDVAPVDDLALIVGTGGTTGKPKGVMLTGRNIETMSALTLMSYPFDGRPVYLALAPLTHAAGVLCFPILTLGGQVVIMPAPDLGQFLAHIDRDRVTHTFLPPTLIYMLLDHADLETTDLSSLQCFWYGAAPISPTRLEEALTRIGPVMAQLFGQSEAPMMIATMAPKDHFHPDGSVATARLSSAGRPTPLVTVAIMDGQGTLLPSGERGEVVVRSSLVMTGYYKNPVATQEASAHGWHHTGDIGYLGEDNFLYIVDRAKDMIVRGGFNVYPREIEEVLMAHQAVSLAAVVGVPHESHGEEVKAFVILGKDADISEGQLIEWTKTQMAAYKYPRMVEFVTSLPMTATGKILKRSLA